PGPTVSCLCGGQLDQLPAGVMHSTDTSLSAGKAAGAQKLWSCRLEAPAPRISTGTDSTGPYAGGREAVARALGSAKRPPPRLEMVTSVPGGTYAKSDGPLKTSSRPASSNRSPAHSTVADPASGSTRISSGPVCSDLDAPGASSTMRNPLYIHPTRSGRTTTRSRWSALVP